MRISWIGEGSCRAPFCLVAFLASWIALAGVSATEENGLLKIEILDVPVARNPNATLFQEIGVSESGMKDFRNDFSSPRIWGMHWRTYLFGAIGTGVAIGDLDGDGLPDIFAASKNERSRLYRNIGDFAFEDYTESSGIDDSLQGKVDKLESPGGGVALADVNNDGHLDIYLSFLDAPNQLWINDGRGKFSEEAERWNVDVNTASVMAYFADYDKDGLLDLYLATNLLQRGDDYPGPKPDHLFRNLGDRFVETTEQAGISGDGHAHSAIWWDYNADGWLDIYVANDFAETDRLYRNNGDGTFSNVIAETSPRAPYYAMGSDFGDINGDGWEDFWVADMAPTSRARFKETLESHRHVYEGGLNQRPYQFMQNVLLLNFHGERFADIASLAGLHRTDWTWATRLIDLDSDGWLDAYATNGMLRNFNDGDLGMRLRGRNTLQHYAQIFKPTPVLDEFNLAYRNNGDLTFESIGSKWGLDKRGVSFGAAFGDLDRDGDMDLVVSNLREPPTVYRNRGTDNNRVLIELRGNESNRFGIGARVVVSADGRSQVKLHVPHRGYMSSDESLIHFGVGSSKRLDSIEIHWPSGIKQRFEDLDTNRRYVIEEKGGAERSASSIAPARFAKAESRFPSSADRDDPGFREFSQQPLLPFARARVISAAASGDVNGDGVADVILGGTSGQGTVTLLGGEGFEFEDVWSLDFEEDFPSSDAHIVLSDINGDGQLDIIAGSGGDALASGDLGYQDRVYWGDGEGGFTREFDSKLSEQAISTNALALGDFNGDGHHDLFVGGGYEPNRYPESSESSLWRGSRDGSFERVDESIVPGLSRIGRVSAAAWISLEGDEHPSLVLAREWGEPQLWRSRENRLELDQEAFGAVSLSGLWTSLALGDFNGDGRVDIAVGNLGLNSGGLWEPSKGPRNLWWRADGRGATLIETHESDDQEWPLGWWDRIKDAVRGRVPIRANSYTDFASSPVNALFGQLAAQDYARLQIREPRSGVFWQDSGGKFRFQAMPMLAQSGRMVKLLSADVGGDGISDLLASVEPPSLAPWTGRPEPGQLVFMKGNANGQLRAETSGVSGLDVGLRSPRDLLWDDFNGDGRNELLVNFQTGLPMIFEAVENRAD